MLFLVNIVLLGWFPFCLLLFAALPPQRAAVVSVIGGWLLLPPTGIPLSGIPDYDKVMAPVASVMFATLIFQPNRLLAFRPKWFDLPAVLWCICPTISSLVNGLGLYDGLSAMMMQGVRWTLPYFIGRLYFGDKEGIRELAVGIAIGGLIWVLPCLFEIRMSPTLLSGIYGIGRYEGTRLGGWRPRVFFSTGLELGMWMTASSLAAVWLWKSGTFRRLGFARLITWCLPVLLVTTLFCRSTGALALLIIGLTILWLSTRLGSNLFLFALLLAAPLYYSVRIPNYWSGDEVVTFFRTFVDKDRADSFAYRIECENRLIEKALQQPVWGWGGWGRARIVDETGRDTTATDGMWVIYLGWYGCVGLLVWTTMMLLPAWLFVLRTPVRQWGDPTGGPMAAMATLLGLYVIDCLVNGFMNLSYVLAAGGLMGIVSSQQKGLRAQREALPCGDQAVLDRAAVIGHDLGPLPPSSARPMTSAAAQAGTATSTQERLADRYRQLARKLRTEGQHGDAKAMLGHAYGILGKLAATHPDDPELQRQRWDCANDLAWLLINEPRPLQDDLNLARNLAQQATEADPEHAAYWNTMGAACFRLGDSASAITALGRSMALDDGGTVFDCVFLSLAHAQAGHRAEAGRWLAKTESLIDRHDTADPDLSRLIDEARGCLTMAQ